MDKFIQKNWKLLFGITLALVLIGLLVRLSLLNHNISESTKQKAYALNIALVNEDQGGKFNNTNYNFGNNFTKYVASDPTNTWNVTSRSIGDSGLKDNTYDMEIIIPAKFTQSSLKVQDVSPNPATLIYKLNPNRNQNMRFAAQTQANKVLASFNRKIVNMYFSSIVGNIHEAQLNVTKMIDTENNLNNGLSNNVDKPFADLSMQFDDVDSQSKSVQEGYNDWKASAESYNQEVNSDLTTMIQNNQSALTSLNDYSVKQNELLQENQTAANKNYDDFVAQEADLSNKWLAKLVGNDDQAKVDYDTLKQSFLKFIGSDSDGDDSESMTKQLESMTTLNNELVDKVDSLNDPYTTAIDGLNAQKEQLENFFYGTTDEEDLTDETMTNHFKEQIETGLNDSEDGDITTNKNGIKAFDTYLENLVQKVPSGSTSTMLNLLAIINSSGGNKTHLKSEIALIEKYAAENDITLSSDQSSEYQSEIDQLKAQKVTVNGAATSIALPADNNGSITVTIRPSNNNVTFDGETEAQSIQNDLGDAFTVTGSNNRITIKANSDNTKGIYDYKPKFTVSGEIINDLAGKTTTDYSISVANKTQTQLIDLSQLVTSIPKLSNDFTDLSNTVSAAYNMISLYYGGNPDEDYAGFRVKDYLLFPAPSLVSQGKQNQDSLFVALQGSGNGAVAKLVAEKLVAAYNSGQLGNSPTDLIHTIDGQITTLEDDQSNVQYWQDSLAAQSENLEKISNTITKFKADLPSMRKLNEDPVAYKPVDKYEFKVDLESGPAMVAQFQDLVTQTEEQVKSTQESAAKVPDMTSYFDELRKTTSTLDNQSKAIIKNTNGLTASWTDTVGKNNSYNDNFKKVLANTKNGGADNQKVYDYLTKPVKNENQGKIKSQVSLVPYYLVLIATFSSLFTAYLLSLFERKRPLKQIDRFINTDSLYWKNLPWTSVIMLTGVGEGIFMAVATKSVLNNSEINFLLWLLVCVLVQTMFVGFSSYLLRQFKTGGMMVLLAVITLYLFFTPSIGIKVLPATGSGFLATISPLQAVENIYTNMLNSSQVDWKVIVLLLIGSVLGSVVNLIVTKYQTNKATRVMPEKEGNE